MIDEEHFIETWYAVKVLCSKNGNSLYFELTFLYNSIREIQEKKMNQLSLCPLLALCLILIPTQKSFARSSKERRADPIEYSKKMTARIALGKIEYFIESKKGAGPKHDADCEDGIFFNDRFLVVIDGATDKSGRTYGPQKKKGGRIASELICRAFRELPPGADRETILKRIQMYFKAFHNRHGNVDFVGKPHFRPTACVIWFDLERNELVALGDCKARIDGKVFNDEEKLVDLLNAGFRKTVINKLGQSDRDVQESDLGRSYIMPLLKAQGRYQNNPEAPEAFQYWVIDGFPIPQEKVLSWSFSKAPEVVELSSDGYLTFPEKLEITSYESALTDALKKDPLRIGANPSTKGLTAGKKSFDDRAVLIFRRNKH